MPEFTLVASAHSLMTLRALAVKNYCTFSSFLFFDPTRLRALPIDRRTKREAQFLAQVEPGN